MSVSGLPFYAAKEKTLLRESQADLSLALGPEAFGIERARYPKANREGDDSCYDASHIRPLSRKAKLMNEN